ncbi:Lymphoid-restricted membrane protein [Liparis tanakae]|uniref:Lymphoid-restricted membrane protein n=1 Tax=Liparis tanakae TaxID=230148 RepID=A0A4Z2J0A0_9TELE|nr:Lymphoid-restricted membrane protein [Liparis tanakae]
MTAQPDAEATSSNPATAPDSEDSDEGTSQEELPITSWNQLSIIERVGLGSMELSEKDLETAFSHIALASRCDQYTLTQRLQAEEHARNLAEDNVRLELTRGRETLEMLKGLCLDTERSDILQRMERSLDVLGGTVERISNTAELLGAVHQVLDGSGPPEARVSRAVKLMVAHVENLKVQHHRNVAELEEVKKRVQQQNSSKPASDPRASPGLRCLVLFVLLGRHIRRRVTAERKTLIRPLDPEETLSDAPAVELRPAPPPSRECLALRQLATRKLRNNKYGVTVHDRRDTRQL